MQIPLVLRFSLPMSTYCHGILLVTCATLAWSTAGLFTRAIALDNWTLLLWRGVFGALAIAVVMAMGNRGHVLRQFQGLGIAGWIFVFVSGVGMVLFITALNHTSVARVSIMYATVPLVTALIAWWILREKPTRYAIAASLVSLVGVSLMMGLSEKGNWVGDLLALGMTLCLAIMMIISRTRAEVPILPAACLSALLSAALALPFSSPFNVEPEQWAMLVLFGVVNSALGLILFIIGSKKIPAIETALITALDAPLAPVWVWLLFNEVPGVFTIAGGTIVFVAVGAYLVTPSK